MQLADQQDHQRYRGSLKRNVGFAKSYPLGPDHQVRFREPCKSAVDGLLDAVADVVQTAVPMAMRRFSRLLP